VTVRHFGRFNRRYPTVQDPKLGVFSKVGFTAHNDYVRMFVELGIPGLVLWVLVFVGAVVIAARARRVRGLEPLATGMFALTLALALMSVSDNLQGYSVVLMYAFAVCGGLSGLAALSASRRSPDPVTVGVLFDDGSAVQVAEPPVSEPEPASEPEPEPAAPAGPARPAPRSAVERGRARVRGLLGARRRRR
jgi:hypothetical protein